MENGLKDRRLTTRQFMRKVLRYYSNSLARLDSPDSVDPLAEFPAEVREECLGLAGFFLRPDGLPEAEDQGLEGTLAACEAGGVGAAPEGGGERGALPSDGGEGGGGGAAPSGGREGAATPPGAGEGGAPPVGAGEASPSPSPAPSPSPSPAPSPSPSPGRELAGEGGAPVFTEGPQWPRWMDGGQVRRGPPDKRLLVEEHGGEKGELRFRVWRRLHDPGESAELRADVGKAGLSKEAFERMQRHICPLGFESDVQYHAFMDELCVCIGRKSHAMQQLAGGQAPLRGFWLVLGGSASQFYSEGWGSITVCCSQSFKLVTSCSPSFFPSLSFPSPAPALSFVPSRPVGFSWVQSVQFTVLV